MAKCFRNRTLDRLPIAFTMPLGRIHKLPLYTSVRCAVRRDSFTVENSTFMKASWKTTAAAVVLLTLWMLSGLFFPNEPDAADSVADDEELLMAVEVTLTDSTRMSRELTLHGQLEAGRRVLVKAQTSGEIKDVLATKGARVDVDEALVKLDEGGRRNSLAEVRASVKSARSEQAAAQTLHGQRLQSKLQLEQADAELEAALARLASVELDIAYTTVRAPFAGIVNGLPIEIGELIERGDLIAEIVDDSKFKMSAQVGQLGRSRLNLGQDVTVQLITGETLQGNISFIAAAADPQTRSFAVEALVKSDEKRISAGVSATMTVPLEKLDATFIAPSAMSLGDDGILGVKAVDDDDRVVFLPVELVSSALDGAWVAGIPDQSRLITLGQGFVNAGDTVRTHDTQGPN